ncbi:TIM barrel protein [Microlunatus panaciterrae]|uniref:Sugar phosphate isomerase/epimerase n=1 Tax=Microlunatus panaciterrae TaxID=400768 RepID=A0ABS2RLD0_9ACTN|nr:sugar phosphate isomerase/epimerase [Microlunatus panaciterrae]MBM7799826.1 sugar phosphate isomerase/epimerase [Microlunatus panaciterrae]
MTTFAVSTWSLHRTLGSYYLDTPADPRDGVAEARWGEPRLSLLELPDELRRRGYDTLQICHFHLPSRDQSYLDELRSALAQAGIRLDAVLIDDGDLTHPTEADAHETWVGEWLDTATALGADRARVIAGMATPTPDRLSESAQRLARLAAGHPGIRVVTENWMDLLPSSVEVHELLQQTGEQVGLLLDLGNWRGATKYTHLASVSALAETCHAKCGFSATGPDAEDFRHCLELLRAADYAGPLALIYDGPDDDEWAMLEREKEIVQSVFG